MYTIFDFDSFAASIPDTVIKLTQNPLISYASNSTLNSPHDSGVADDGDSMTMALADECEKYPFGLDSKAILVIEPELAKKLDLKNWNF